MPPKYINYQNNAYTAYYDSDGKLHLISNDKSYSCAKGNNINIPKPHKINAKGYIETNINLLDDQKYEKFIDECPASIFAEVMTILFDAEVEILKYLSQEKKDKIEKILGYPF